MDVAGSGDRVMVCVRRPGIGAHWRHDDDDRAYAVLTLSGGRIVALRDCRDGKEARSVAGLG